MRHAVVCVSGIFANSTAELRTGTLSREEDCHLIDTTQYRYAAQYSYTTQYRYTQQYRYAAQYSYTTQYRYTQQYR